MPWRAIVANQNHARDKGVPRCVSTKREVQFKAGGEKGSKVAPGSHKLEVRLPFEAVLQILSLRASHLDRHIQNLVVVFT